MNDAAHRIVADHPGRLVGYVTVNPGTSDDMAAVVEREVRERGARGAPVALDQAARERALPTAG